MTYNEREASESMHANAPTSGASLFTALSGETLLISANSLQEAQQKLNAYWRINDSQCPCGDDDCECVQEGETLTMFIDGDRNV